jgi:hypothetical protein
LDSTLRRFGGHVPAAPAISATIAPSLEPSAAVDTARMGATVTRPRPRRTVAGARSAAAGALMEASAAEDVIAAECCAGRKYRPFYKYFYSLGHIRSSWRFITGSLWNKNSNRVFITPITLLCHK